MEGLTNQAVGVGGRGFHFPGDNKLGRAGKAVFSTPSYADLWGPLLRGRRKREPFIHILCGRQHFN